MKIELWATRGSTMLIKSVQMIILNGLNYICAFTEILCIILFSTMTKFSNTFNITAIVLYASSSLVPVAAASLTWPSLLRVFEV